VSMKFLPFLLLITNLLSAQIKPEIFSKTLDPDSARRDMELLRALFDEFHPGEFQHSEKEQFEVDYQNLLKEINGELSPLDLYKKVQRFCVFVKDGHTFSDHSLVVKFLNSRQVVPFNIFKIENKFYIRKVASDSLKYLIGKELIAINAIPILDIIKKIEPYLDREGQNESGFQRKYQLFPFYYFLTDTATSYAVEYKDTLERVASKKIAGVTYAEFLKKTRVIVEPVSFDVDENKIGILHVNTFVISDFESRKIDYKQYFDDIFKRCRKETINRLIIDVRGNGGGSPEVSNYLFSYLKGSGSYFYNKEICTKYRSKSELAKCCTTPAFLPNTDTVVLIKKEGLYCEINNGKSNYWGLRKQKPKKRSFQGKLVVLEDGGCFSTTGHFIALIKNYNIGQIVGDYSMGSSYSNDGGLYFQLPYSKFKVRIPTTYFEVDVANFAYDPKGIKPDILILPSLSDFLSGRDVQMVEAKRLLLTK
jgi:hypothetical protein